MIFGMIPLVASAAEDNEQSGTIFKDVKETSWYYDAVNYVYENGIMAGTSDTTFSPGEVTSRSMLVTILYGMEGKPSVHKESPFTDVANGRWYTDAIVWASENGVVSGYGNGIFGINDKITVEQAAVILARYAGYIGITVQNGDSMAAFADSGSVSGWVEHDMKWIVSEGIYTGVNGRLNPQSPASRALIAGMLYNFDSIS